MGKQIIIQYAYSNNQHFNKGIAIHPTASGMPK